VSRLEEALEKAAQLREQKDSAPVGDRLGEALEKAIGHQPDGPDLFPRARGGYGYRLPEEGLTITDPLVVTYNDPRSPIAEEFRKLKSTLMHLEQAGKGKRSLMITSALGGEGKSVTTINLAITLAQEFDHTVLMVDADLRKPTLHRYLGVPAAPGLADCLVDGVNPAETIIRTGLGKLSFLPAGREVENPAELLSSERMRQLVQQMRRRYPDRFLLIDTPPILPVAEARILSNLVDGVIFVVREGAVGMADLQEAVAGVQREKILGIVYNNVRPESLQGRYHYYYNGY
jgi:exopolysaccharide/PEP-CTERM locus tyrosine autokinase